MSVGMSNLESRMMEDDDEVTNILLQDLLATNQLMNPILMDIYDGEGDIHVGLLHACDNDSLESAK